jgi:argininosuccinate lyase
MAKKLWGGRFGKKTDPLVEEFTKSIQHDYKLAEYDVLGSISHVEILKKSGYLTSEEASKLKKELNFIYASIEKGSFKPDPKCEDIHTNIQNILQKKVGDLALKIHTARSRNDQVVFATKLYCKSAILDLQLVILKLAKTILGLIKNNKQVIIPGFTHMQHAQPVMLKDYLGTYAQMLARDDKRLSYISENMRITMGAGALACTPISASDYKIKNLLEATDNSLDSVSDRDFVIEIISALSIVAMHLSRLAEDLIIWSTKEFDFVEIDEAFCTGSSLMPQKKNPDVLELIRGYAGRLYGNLVSVLMMMKGLPLTYNRDMQLDKEPLFNSFEIVSSELKVLIGLIKTLKFNKAKIEEQLKDESLYATDLVYYLVDKKIPFKNAHTIIGKLVKYSIDNDIKIKDMPEILLKKFSGKLVKKEIVKLFDSLVSVKSKKSIKR